MGVRYSPPVRGFSIRVLRKLGMDRRNLDRYQRILLEKRDAMSVTTVEAESPIPAAGGQRGDPVDQANADAEAELQIHLHKTDARLLRAIKEALARIRNGTFGTCVACRNPISRARLEAVPWTRLCRDCKEREHSL
jgi:DnaK suppressor protein